MCITILCSFEFFFHFIAGIKFQYPRRRCLGAYFACMLRDPTDDTAMKNVKEEEFVPELSLNAHVKKQLQVRIPRQQQHFLLQRNIIQQAVKSLNFSGGLRNF